ncbi:MAG: PTS mannitol transporter subunit IICB [Acidimicrobiia bacterium]|nr:PTS mannitol transporter subunit IICB [Acidimicrobiia bacterium]
MQARLQKLGGWLAAMVIPNIGAFIAWGLITALFIDTGWLVKLGLFEIEDVQPIAGATVGPMIKYLLPLLIAYTGGKLVHGHRGGVVGAIAVMGAIGAAAFELSSGAAGDPPQFLGAMVIGPLAGWVMMKVDEFLEPRTPAGFEMLFNNFSQGFAGLFMTLIAYWIVGPLMSNVAKFFGNIVESIADAGLLPLADIPIEVAKVLFLNNAINHGVLTPLGAEDVAEKGRSIYFMLESNPGPGLGLLGAYWFAGKGLAKLSAPGAIIIHFFGGIHEVYFPYVLMNPVMIGAMWAGGITADLVFVATDAGLTGPPSPGSIFAYLTFLPSEGGAAFGVLAGVAVGAVMSFVTGTALLRMFPVKEMTDTEIDAAAGDMMPDVPGMNVPGATA